MQKSSGSIGIKRNLRLIQKLAVGSSPGLRPEKIFLHSLGIPNTLQHNVVTVYSYSSRDPYHFDLRGSNWLEKKEKHVGVTIRQKEWH